MCKVMEWEFYDAKRRSINNGEILILCVFFLSCIKKKCGIRRASCRYEWSVTGNKKKMVQVEKKGIQLKLMNESDGSLEFVNRSGKRTGTE